jgi:hypothetical protein
VVSTESAYIREVEGRSPRRAQARTEFEPSGHPINTAVLVVTPWKEPRGLRLQEGSHLHLRALTWSHLQGSRRCPRMRLSLIEYLCLLPGPRRRSRVWVRQATQNQQTLIRNPAKGEQGSESPPSGPARP